ncbi:hypothetical protein Tco_1476474 [Tanacetum coccineum]
MLRGMLEQAVLTIYNTAETIILDDSQAVPTNASRKVNTVKPIVNNVRPKTVFHKTYSPIRRPFNRTTAPRTKFSNQKVNTAEVKAVSAVGGKRETAVKPSAGCNWRPKRHYWNKVSKYNGGSNSRKCDYPQRALKNKGIVDSGCSRHMTGNKAYLAEYQDYNGGPVAFGAWFRAARLKKQQKKKDMEKSKKRRSVSKQGRKAVKSSKASLNEAMDYTVAQDEGKTDSKVEEPKTSSKTEELHLSGDTLVVEDKGSAEKGGSTKGTDLQQSTVKPDEGTDKQDESTDSFVEGTAEIKDQDVERESGYSNSTQQVTSTPSSTFL